MTVREDILAILSDALQPSSLEVVDESHLHAGHGGWRPEGETHMRVAVVSQAFAGKRLVDRHRLINALLQPQLRAGLHALAIEAKAPTEVGAPGPDLDAVIGNDGRLQ